MPRFVSKRRVRHTAPQMFDLVADVERYPEFLPLCTGLRVVRRTTEEDGKELLLVHGAPSDPTVELSDDLTDEEMNVLLGDDPADVVVCGMSHVPFDRTVGDVRIINVGSIGEAPSSAGPRVAHATWIDSTPNGLLVEPITVPLSAPLERAISMR